MKYYTIVIKVLHLPTRAIRTYRGYFTLKECYQILKKYEKEKDFALHNVEFNNGDDDMFSDELRKQLDDFRE